MEAKSRVLVIGATGKLGRHLVQASLLGGHPTAALVRPSSFSNPINSHLLRSFSLAGVNLLQGSLQDFPSLVSAIKQVDVVISAVPSKEIPAQQFLIHAIKEAGGVKRFIPAEFGTDPYRVHVLNLQHSVYNKKADIRVLIEREQIPHTYICCYFFADYLLPSLVQPNLEAPPRDKVVIFGDGDTKAVFVTREDVASFTINTLDDPRTLNKAVYLRPPGNVCSINKLVEIWEQKIEKQLERVYMSEDQILEKIRDTPFPDNMNFVYIYSAFIKGDHTNYEIEQFGLDGTKLYPHIKCITVGECLDSLV